MQGMTQSYNVYDSISFKNTKAVKDKIHNDKKYSLAEEDQQISEMIKSPWTGKLQQSNANNEMIIILILRIFYNISAVDFNFGKYCNFFMILSSNFHFLSGKKTV